MPVPDTAIDGLHEQGYALVEGFLRGRELAEARDALWSIYPRPAAYFADPSAPEHARLGRSQFDGVRAFPFGDWALDRLPVHDALVDAAERFLGSIDIELYKAELWAKYAGAVAYDQPPHRDFNNHSLVVPRRDGRWPQLTTYLLLSDVTELDAPPMFVPLDHGARLPFVPNQHDGRGGPEMAATGPAGTLVLFRSDVVHRATDFAGPGRSRFILLADFQQRGQPWMGKMSWPGRALEQGMYEALERMTVRQRDLLGFPPPGHEYWNDQTLTDVQARYPGMDLTPYKDGVRWSPRSRQDSRAARRARRHTPR